MSIRPVAFSIALRIFSALLCVHAASALAASQDSERARIASERAAANAKFAERQRECQTKFVITSCVNEALTEQRATLGRLHKEQMLLDEHRRHDAAATRREEIGAKAQAQDSRASDVEPPAPNERVRSAPQPRPAPRLKPERSRFAEGRSAFGANGSASAASSPDQRSVEQRNQDKFEANARAAKAHREAVELRNAQRAAHGKVAAPLSMPSAASAP